MLPPTLHFQETPFTGEVHAVFESLRRHPTLPLTLRREFYEASDSTGIHRHRDFLALYAVRGGRGLHVIDGQIYTLTRGDIYLMAADATHAYRDYQKLEIDAFYFQPSLFTEGEQDVLRTMPEFWGLFAGGETPTKAPLRHRLHLRPEAWREVENQIEELRHEWADESAAGPLLLRAGLFALLVKLTRLLKTTNTPANAPQKETSPVAEIVRFCEENFALPLSVPQLAARFFISPGHLSELFAREIGMPPAAYIRRLRLERAGALLRETDESVTHIAQSVGFGDVAHFTRSFRAMYRLSPLQFRKNAQEK